MALSIPKSEPSVVVAGTTWQWDKTLPDFRPADGWYLRYKLGATAVLPDIVASAATSGTSFEIRQTPAVTGDVEPATYEIAGWAYNNSDFEQATEIHEVYRDRLIVRAHPDLVTSSESADERALRIISAAVEGRLTDGMDEFQINGRAVKYVPLETLLKLQGTYRARVRAAQSVGGFGRRHKVRF